MSTKKTKKGPLLSALDLAQKVTTTVVDGVYDTARKVLEETKKTVNELTED